MPKKYYDTFNSNTDAVATNRGFYYQYLIFLKKWITNYISQKDDHILYTEVDEDIKEVGDELIFTQVKSYSSSLSFKSEEIRKTLFNFYIHFLKYHETIPVKLCFETNTSVIKSETLLKAWIANPLLTDLNLKQQSVKKIKEILISELNSRKNNRLRSNRIDSVIIDEIKLASKEFKDEIDSKVELFVSCIQWDFLDKDPEVAIIDILSEIRVLLNDARFQNKPVSILESILLSEIYKCSQINEKENRLLKNSTIENILQKTNTELEDYVNLKFLDLVIGQYNQVKNIVEELQGEFQKTQIENDKRFSLLNESIEELKGENATFVLPKELTLLPIIFTDNIHGRDNSILELNEILDASPKVIISGYGGIGKSVFVQYFLQSFQHKYDHIIWLDSMPSLLNAVALNDVLLKNLKLNFTKEHVLEQRFNIVCNELNKINGKNLIVIDNFENDYNSLRSLNSLTNWSVIVISRGIVNGLTQYKLPQLDFDSAKAIFSLNLDRQILTEESDFIDFFKFIDYNPLIIRLAAKTISYSLDLNLPEFYKHLTTQTLDNNELNIDLYVGDDKPIRLLNYLQQTYKVKNLERNEEFFLEFLSLLPPQGIVIEELIEMCGKEYYNKNKIDYTNWVNSLHQKGWIERQGGELKMPRMVQELIKYNLRNEKNNFFSVSFLIIWLMHRIDEVSQINPHVSFKYLKYAESILNSIKENDRDSIYQPLLILENALLNAYNWFDLAKDTHERWIDLTRRSEDYLSDDDRNLGIIFNNMGLSYFNQGDLHNSIKYFLKSIQVLEVNESGNVDMMIISYSNLSSVYIEEKDITKTIDILNKILKLRSKYSLKEDQYFATYYNILAQFFQRAGDLGKALMCYSLAITIHLNLDENNRNDFNLAMYYTNLSCILFALKRHDNVILNLNKALDILEKMNLFESSGINTVYKLLSEFYDYYGDKENAILFQEKYKNCN